MRDEISKNGNGPLGVPVMLFFLTACVIFGAASYAYAGPTINSLSPRSGGPMGGYKLTIYGSGFVKATHVTIGGKICALKSQSVTEIECYVPACSPAPGPGASASVPVVVTVGGMNSNSLSFTYSAPLISLPGSANFR